AMSSLQLMVVLASTSVLLPIITRHEFHTNTVFALSEVGFSVGATVSALVAIKLKSKHPGLMVVLLWALFAVVPIVLAFPSSRILIIAGYVIAGLSIGPWEAYWSAALQREIPQELQGRVFSVDYMGSIALMPLGMALVGPVTDALGVRPFLIFAAIFHLVLCFAVLLIPGVKDLKMPKKNDYSQGEQDEA
ncbi:MAG: MFS transporter, partial [Streptomycetaceae bacterium]